jgi:uncharacterized protein (DUF1499 family)
MVGRALSAAALLCMAFLLWACAEPKPGIEDLRRIARPSSPNFHLICAPGICAGADEDGPVFALPPERVLVAALKVAALMPDTGPADADPALGQLVFIQRTKFLRFPDLVRVQAVALPGGGSALALMSRSIHGYYDFGVNRRRAREWMEAIKAELGRG